MILRDSALSSALKHRPITSNSFSDDQHKLSNNRPISNSHILSKVKEELVSSQLTDFSKGCNFIDSSQKAYKACHSTRRAPIHISSSLLWLFSKRENNIQGNTDPTASFERVDFDFFCLGKLNGVGVKEKTLALITSYRTDWAQPILIHGNFPTIGKVTRECPQGFVLQSLLFYGFYLMPLNGLLSSNQAKSHI